MKTLFQLMSPRLPFLSKIKKAADGGSAVGGFCMIRAKKSHKKQIPTAQLCRGSLLCAELFISRWAASRSRRRSCRPDHHRFDCPSSFLSPSFLFCSLWYSICRLAPKCNGKDYTFLPRYGATFLTFCPTASCLLRLHYYIMGKTVKKREFL